jgi:threonine synthase
MADDGCFLTHLECSATAEIIAADQLQGASPAGAPLLARYDLDAVREAVSRADLITRPADMWRYRELLPYPDASPVVTLGEPWTPLLPIANTVQAFGGETALVKDEGRLPTGSFKARGLAMAVTMAKFFEVEKIAMPSAGNAGAALAAYAAKAGIDAWVYVPDDAPEIAVEEAALHGAQVHRVAGLIDACGQAVAEATPAMGWFDMSTLKEPYRIEGKKTMGLELAEQLNWQLPDVIFYPTGGGTGLIGMWKAFGELKHLGWVEGAMPRMVAVQTTGCGPVVKAFEAGARDIAEPWADVDTTVHGVRVRKPFGDRLILDALYESNGFAIAVEDREAEGMRGLAAREDGMHLCPEGAACLAAYARALGDGRVNADDQAIIFNSASGLKSPMPTVD